MPGPHRSMKLVYRQSPGCSLSKGDAVQCLATNQLGLVTLVDPGPFLTDGPMIYVNDVGPYSPGLFVKLVPERR